MLNAQPMGFYSPATLIRDAIRHGVEVRPPDLSKSYWNCTLELCDDIEEDDNSGQSMNAGEPLTSSRRLSARQIDNRLMPFAYAIAEGEYDKDVPHTFRSLVLDELIERDQLPEQNSENQHSKPRFALRIGLRYVRGLGRKAQDTLESAWGSGGMFTTFDDVLNRSGLGANDLKLLAKCGAFETLFPGRRNALWETLSRLEKRATPLLDLLKKRKCCNS